MSPVPFIFHGRYPPVTSALLTVPRHLLARGPNTQLGRAPGQWTRQETTLPAWTAVMAAGVRGEEEGKEEIRTADRFDEGFG